jgi:hypothetical protein
LVECDLAKVDVAGSNPVSRSKTSDPTWNRDYQERSYPTFHKDS